MTMQTRNTAALQQQEREFYERAMSGTPLADIGQIPPGIKRVLNSDVRCGNLKKIRAPFAFVPGFGFTAMEKSYYCLMRGCYGQDWTREMLLEYLQRCGMDNSFRILGCDLSKPSAPYPVQ